MIGRPGIWLYIVLIKENVSANYTYYPSSAVVMDAITTTTITTVRRGGL
jgi:hypothetical protein